MKRIYHIAKNELYTLFYSPIAWLLMMLFVVMTSADYIEITNDFIANCQRGGFFEYLTNSITANPRYGYLFGVIHNLYIFFPLITMGLISRETSSGTIKLLYSSPVRVREIVLGKFLAITCFTICLLLLVCLTLFALCAGMIHPDYGSILGSLFGLFFVLSTYAAIGLFISSLTSYQIVAAIITFAIFFFLSKSGDLWQDVDIVRNITYYLNMGIKSYNLVRGLPNLRDICYFMILITGFLSFTIIRIKSGTESISRFKKARRYVIVIAIAFGIGYLTKSPYVNFYFDTTRNEILTITPHTQALLAKLNDGDLEIIGFSNLFNGYDRWGKTNQNYIITTVWEPYIRFKPNIKFTFLNYYDLDSTDYHFKVDTGKTLREIAEKEAETYSVDFDQFLSPAEVNRMVDVKAEERRSFFLLKYKGRSAIVRTFNDGIYWPMENEIAAAINRLILPTPKIGFLCDEIERGPFSKRGRDYRMITHELGSRASVINAGFDIDTFSLHQKEIPAGLSALMIADPRTPISAESLVKIKNYIDTGGNVFITTEPDRKEVTKPLLDMLGLALHDGLLIQSSDKFSSDVVFPSMSDTARNLSPQMARDVKRTVKYYGDKLLRVAMAGANVLDYKEKDGFHVSPLLQTISGISWNRLAPIGNDSLQMKVEKKPDDENGSFVPAVLMTRMIHGRQQRIVVASDADLITESYIFGWNPRRFNFSFDYWLFCSFSYGEFPTNTMRPDGPDGGFTVTVDSIPPQKLIFYWIIPGLIGVGASILLIRRKRK